MAAYFSLPSLFFRALNTSLSCMYLSQGRNQFDNLDGKYMTCEFIVQALKSVPDGDYPPFAGFGPDIGGIGADMYGPNFPYDFVDSYKYGVNFQMEATGQLGTFDTQCVIDIFSRAWLWPTRGWMLT